MDNATEREELLYVLLRAYRSSESTEDPIVAEALDYVAEAINLLKMTTTT